MSKYLRPIAIFFLCLSAVGAAADLSREIAANAINYMEWLLDATFTADQAQRYQQILTDTFRGHNQGAKDGVILMARGMEKLRTMSESDQAAFRSKVQPEFLRMAEKAGDAHSRWILSVYEAAHSAAPIRNSSAPATNMGNSPIIGKWSTSHISSIQYKNAYTGVPGPTNGSSFSYEFLPDGTYHFTGLMQLVMYNCTTSTFSNETGSYTIEGNSVSLRPESNPYKMTYSCTPSSNKEAPGKLINKTYRFRTFQESGVSKIELTGDTGTQVFNRSR